MLKKRIFIVSGIIIGLFFIVIIAGRVTGMLQYYSIPNPVNEPTIRVGDFILASTLKKAVPYKFIVFTNERADSMSASIPDFSPGSTYLHRLCGTEGDILEMRNGVLWVNSKNFDDDLNLNNQYTTIANAYSLMEEKDLESPDRFMQITSDSAIVTFDNSLLKKYRKKFGLVPFIISDTTNGCFKWHDKYSTWTPDNFGPLKVPANNYFVLGDNRHNSLDSRYIGFIKKGDIKGVVLNK
ncbi:MAG TPA: signal peptidase I [Ferruginibacter sp.]|nr:signal peptidase I [Ferruginibacter sp.]